MSKPDLWDAGRSGRRQQVLERRDQYQMSVVAYDNAGGRYAARLLDAGLYQLRTRATAQWGLSPVVGRGDRRPDVRKLPSRACPAMCRRMRMRSLNGDDLLTHLGQQGVAVIDTRTVTGQETWGGRLLRSYPRRAIDPLGPQSGAEEHGDCPRATRFAARLRVAGIEPRPGDHRLWSDRGGRRAHLLDAARARFRLVKLYDGAWAEEVGAERNAAKFPVEPLAVGTDPTPPLRHPKAGGCRESCENVVGEAGITPPPAPASQLPSVALVPAIPR